MVWAALLGALLLAALLAAWVWREPLGELCGDQASIQAWLARFGPLAPLVSIGLNAAQVLLAPIPGQVVGLANGYLYGVWLGTLYSTLGLLVGTTLAMLLARHLGRPLVERLVARPRLERWDRMAARQGPWFFFLVFLIPGLPDDLVCFVIGLSGLPLPRMIVLAMLGRLPGVWVSCWVGARASALPWWAWLPLGAGAAALAAAFWRYQPRIETTLVRLIAGWSSGRQRRSEGEAEEPAPAGPEHGER